MIPKGNGLVEILGEEPVRDRGFFCMDLIKFLSEEVDKTGDGSWETWHRLYRQAEDGNCPFRDTCSRHARTMERIEKQPHQLSLF